MSQRVRGKNTLTQPPWAAFTSDRRHWWGESKGGGPVPSLTKQPPTAMRSGALKTLYHPDSAIRGRPSVRRVTAPTVPPYCGSGGKLRDQYTAGSPTGSHQPPALFGRDARAFFPSKSLTRLFYEGLGRLSRKKCKIFPLFSKPHCPSGMTEPSGAYQVASPTRFSPYQASKASFVTCCPSSVYSLPVAHSRRWASSCSSKRPFRKDIR